MKNTICAFSLGLLYSMSTLAASSALETGNHRLDNAYFKSGISESTHMPPRISLNPKLHLHMKAYRGVIANYLNNAKTITRMDARDITRSFAGAASKGEYAYYLVGSVKEMGRHCIVDDRKKFRLSNKVNVGKILCRTDKKLFIVGSSFRRLKIEDQTLAIFHESLTKLTDEYGGKNYSAMAQILEGSREVVRVTKQQKKKIYQNLSVTSHSKVQGLFDGVMQIVYRKKEAPVNALDFVVHRNGGGLVHSEAQVVSSAFVSLNSTISNRSKIDANVKIIDTHLKNHFTIAQGVTLKNISFDSSNYNTFKIGARSQLVNTKFVSASLDIGQDSLIKDSHVESINLKAGSGLKVINSSIDSDLVKNYRSNSRRNSRLRMEMALEGDLQYRDVTLVKNQSLINGTITYSLLKNNIPLGLKLEEVQVEVPTRYPSEQCSSKSRKWLIKKFQSKYGRKKYPRISEDIGNEGSVSFACKFKIKSSTWKPLAKVTLAQSIFADGGAELKVTEDMDYITNKKTKRGHYSLSIYNSYSGLLKLTNREVSENRGQYTVYQGEIKPAGQSRLRTIRFNHKDHNYSSILAGAFANKLRAAGLTVNYPKEDTYRVYLKIAGKQ